MIVVVFLIRVSRKVANIVDVQPMAAKKMNRQTVGLARASQSLLRSPQPACGLISKEQLYCNRRPRQALESYANIAPTAHCFCQTALLFKRPNPVQSVTTKTSDSKQRDIDVPL
eukprot:6092644-Amphidinium_carterae.1